MATSLLAHRGADGAQLYAVLSLSAIRSLKPSQVEALRRIGIQRVSDLLHFTPVHNARLIVAAARGQIAHDLSLADMLDSPARSTPLQDMPKLPIEQLTGIGEAVARIFKEHFEVRTIADLADFSPFVEAQRFLTPAADVFREPASAPDELIPKAIGSVASTVNYSSFVREQHLRLEGLELVYDDRREHYVDPRLAALFPVRGIGPIFLRGLSGFGATEGLSIGRQRFPRLQASEPELHLGYVAKLSQRWVNMGTHLGEVIHSLALAPGESRNIAIVDWKRSQRTQRVEDTQVAEQLSNQLIHTRALDEVTRSVAAEHQSGGTQIAAGTLVTSAATVMGAAVAGGVAGAVPGATIGAVIGAIVGTPTGPGDLATTLIGAGAGAVIGLGFGAAMAGGAALVGAANAQLGTIQNDSSGNREIIAQLQQSITDMTSQKSSSLRSLWSNVIVTDEQAESERLTTRNVTNYNHSHALTIQYYEVLQHYRAEVDFKAAEPLLFLPFRPLEFTVDLIADYWSILKKGIDNARLQREFEAIVRGHQEKIDPERQPRLESVFVSVRRFGVMGEIFGMVGGTNAATVALLGGNEVRRSAPVFAGHAVFAFDDHPASVQALRRVQVVGLSPQELVGIEVKLTLRDEENRREVVFRDSGLINANNGIATFEFSLLRSPADTPPPYAITEIERYFNARRYFFTRLLLLSLEREQLVDLVEALMLRAAVQVERPQPPSTGISLPSPSRGLLPSLLSIGAFVPRRRTAADAVTETTAGSVYDELLSGLRTTPAQEELAVTGPDAETIATRLTVRVYETLRAVNPEKPGDRDRVATAVKNSIADLLRSVPGLDEARRGEMAERVKDMIGKKLDDVFGKPELTTSAVHLSEFIEPEPLAITGNTLIFRMRRVDRSVLQNVLVQNRLQAVVEYPDQLDRFVRDEWPKKSQRIVADDIYLPTSGVFAEAILGRSNASEKIDVTRFFNWQDSPIPHLAPQIAALQAGSRAQEPLDTKPTVPSGVLNIVNPPAFPDPTGLAAVLAAIQNANIFRDMSKSDQLVTVMSNLSGLAQNLAQQAGSLAGQAQVEALRSAAEIGGQVAQLAAQSASQPSNLPTSPTSQGAAANLLEQLRQTAPGILDTLPADIKKVIGIQPSVDPAPNREELLKSRGDVSELVNEFARSGIEEMKLKAAGEAIELRRGTSGNTTTAGLIDLGSKALPATIDDWREVFMHTVPDTVIQELRTRGFDIQGFDFAENVVEVFTSPINLDYYEVRISQRPRKADGTVYSPTELINDIRLNMSDLIDVSNLHRNPFASSLLALRFTFGHLALAPASLIIPTVVAFLGDTTLDPFDEAIDLPKWNSSSPLGAVMQFNNKLDDMGVVLSKFDAVGWIFTTIRDGRLPFTGDVGTHPVSGNRRFGIRENADGTMSVFTRGADRSTGVLETGPLGLVFLGGHVIWLSWQAGVVEFIEKRGGFAQIVKPFSERFNFTKVNQHFRGIPA